MAYHQKGTQGAPPPATNEPALVLGGIPGLTPHKMGYTQLVDNQDLLAPVNGPAYYIKTVAPATLDGAPPCDIAKLGADWRAQPENPATVNVNPDQGARSCGLAVDATRAGTGTVERMPVSCSPQECIVRGGSLNNAVLGMEGADGQQDTKAGRDAVIAGLHTPPGVQPGGTRMTSPQLASPDGTFALAGSADGASSWATASTPANRSGATRSLAGRACADSG